MVKNVRWLYAKLGNEDFSTTGQSTVTGALSSLQSELDGKSNESHTHSVDSLPVSNNQVNSTSYIPTSALLFSMSQRAEGIQSVVSIAKRELDDPNTRYESKNLGTWSSLSDVDTFLSQYTHENNYEGLSVGNSITISTQEYRIAGFDMECMQTAADGTIYDNGYGICLIPNTFVYTAKWKFSNSTTGGYINSDIHNESLPDIVTKLKNVLGDHIVNRNVLLSSSVSTTSPFKSNAYTWTTSEATLMSIGQMTGKFASHKTKYDDGEANYKLPLFNYESYRVISYNVWTRCIYGTGSAYYIDKSGSIDYDSANSVLCVRPLIYIR